MIEKAKFRNLYRPFASEGNWVTIGRAMNTEGRFGYYTITLYNTVTGQEILLKNGKVKWASKLDAAIDRETKKYSKWASEMRKSHHKSVKGTHVAFESEPTSEVVDAVSKLIDFVQSTPMDVLDGKTPRPC